MCVTRGRDVQEKGIDHTCVRHVKRLKSEWKQLLDEQEDNLHFGAVFKQKHDKKMPFFFFLKIFSCDFLC